MVDTIDKLFSMASDVDKLLSNPRFWMSTGSTLLDLALRGGYPTGREIEIYGEESSGKTTLALHAVRESQNRGQNLWLDSEVSFDYVFARKLGVDLSKLPIDFPRTLESGVTKLSKSFKAYEDICKSFYKARTGNDYSGNSVILDHPIPMLVVWDSIAQAPPQAESGGMYSAGMAIKPRLLHLMARNSTIPAAEANAAMLFLNHTMSGPGGHTTPGGKALHFQCSYRLFVRRTGFYANSEEQPHVGYTMEVYINKSKFSPPIGMLGFPITLFVRFDSGIDDVKTIVEFCRHNGLMGGGGGWFRIPNSNFGGKRYPEIFEMIDKDPTLLDYHFIPAIKDFFMERFKYDYGSLVDYEEVAVANG